MDSARQLIKQSIDQYQTILFKAESLENQLGQLDNDALQETASWLTSAMEEVRTTDMLVNEAYQHDKGLLELPLSKKRTVLIEQLMTKNDKLSGKLQGIMAVQQIELKKIRQGMHTMEGYSPATQKTGRLINSSN